MTTTSLFDRVENQAVIARIRKLRPDSKPQWGKMDAARMLAHCQVALRVAMGETRLKRGLIGLLFGRMALRSLLKPAAFKRNMPTAPEFRVKATRGFEVERDELVRLVETFAAKGPAGLLPGPHPFFGPMTTEQWDTLQWKHLDHHLNQFGV
jgi:Protein of unknown function (DUF1569)